MGMTLSHYVANKSLERLDKKEYAEESEEYSDAVEIPDVISEDLLINILSYVPVKDLIFNCRLVCKHWKCLIDAQSIWRLKCERENIKLPSRKLPQLPNHHYRYVYCHSTSRKKNLLHNPCGENKFEGWNGTPMELTRFQVENPPAGADPVPDEVGSQSCFATTYSLCAKYQILNLRKNPINEYLLRYDLVKIRVGEWHAARFDCASEYELSVLLVDDKNNFIDNFDFRYEEEQWCGREWHLVTHEFDNVKDAFSLRFYHQGKDRQFWAGHYGSKMTGGFVELCIK